MMVLLLCGDELYTSVAVHHTSHHIIHDACHVWLRHAPALEQDAACGAVAFCRAVGNQAFGARRTSQSERSADTVAGVVPWPLERSIRDTHSLPQPPWHRCPCDAPPANHCVQYLVDADVGDSACAIVRRSSGGPLAAQVSLHLGAVVTGTWRGGFFVPPSGFPWIAMTTPSDGATGQVGPCSQRLPKIQTRQTMHRYSESSESSIPCRTYPPLYLKNHPLIAGSREHQERRFAD